MDNETRVREVIKCRDSFEYFCTVVGVTHSPIIPQQVNNVSKSLLNAYLLWDCLFSSDSRQLVVAPSQAVIKEHQRELVEMLTLLSPMLGDVDSTLTTTKSTMLVLHNRINFAIMSRNCGKGMTINTVAALCELTDDYKCGIYPAVCLQRGAILNLVEDNQ